MASASLMTPLMGITPILLLSDKVGVERESERTIAMRVPKQRMAMPKIIRTNVIGRLVFAMKRYLYLLWRKMKVQ
jgi:hypothetical protein